MMQIQQYIDTLKAKAEEAGLAYKEVFEDEHAGKTYLTITFPLSEPFADKLWGANIEITDEPANFDIVETRCATLIRRCIEGKARAEKELAERAAAKAGA